MNNLTQREKVLIYVIIGTLPVVLLYFGFNWFMGQLKAKSVKLDQVSRQLADIDARSEQAIEKTLLKNQLKQRSLSSQENVAQGEYREWLRQLVEEDIKFKGAPKVTWRVTTDFKSEFGKKNVIYKQLNFQLDCQGTYGQLVELLYKFYEKNYIHKITRLDLNLVKGKRVEGKVTFDRNKFNVKAQIQVLSLVDADEARSPIAVENIKLFYQDAETGEFISSLEDYNAIVMKRNLFGFPNNPPDFGSRKKTFDFEEGDRVSLRLSADDEDDDDLEYMLTSTDGKVNSDQIDQSRPGSFKLDIEKLGSYEFKAMVTDKANYPKSDDMLVVVNIEEKEPEPPKKDPDPPAPKFDPLKFTFLEAIVQNFAGQPICWINVRPLGTLHKVAAGAEFEVGKREVKVVKINRRDVIISIDGDQYLFSVNDSLGQPKGDRIASSEPKEAKSDDDVDAGNDSKTLDVNTENPNASKDTPGAQPGEKPSEDKSVKAETSDDSKDQTASSDSGKDDSATEDAAGKTATTAEKSSQPGEGESK